MKSRTSAFGKATGRPSWGRLGSAGLPVLAICAAARCTPHATKADCDAVLDRYVEMLVREHNPTLNGTKLEDQIRSARSRARALPSFEDCPRQVRADAVRCALEAGDPNAIERCLE